MENELNNCAKTIQELSSNKHCKICNNLLDMKVLFSFIKDRVIFSLECSLQEALSKDNILDILIYGKCDCGMYASDSLYSNVKQCIVSDNDIYYLDKFYVKIFNLYKAITINDIEYKNMYNTFINTPKTKEKLLNKVNKILLLA